MVQPVDRIDGEWLVYGMGNLLSNQPQLARRDELIVVAHIEEHHDGGFGVGRRYTASWVRYDHRQSLLYTDAPVTMEDDTGTFRGDGFRYHVKERRFHLLGNVSLEQTP